MSILSLSNTLYRYLLAPSVGEKNQVTWANQVRCVFFLLYDVHLICPQTFGGRFAADGRLSGTEVVQTISCDQNANTCVIPVPAPGAALVFISSDAQSSSDPSTTQTYATTAVTNPAQSINIDPTALANSNGRSGGTGPLAGTSKGGANGAGRILGGVSMRMLFTLASYFVFVYI